MLNPLPPAQKIKIDIETVNLINDAEKSFLLLEGALSVLPQNHHAIQLLKLNESINSFRVDGFNYGIINYWEQEEEVLIKVNDYLSAVELGEKLLKNVAHASHIIKSVHKELLGSDTEISTNGFRDTNSWVGNYSTSVDNAEYIPPEPADIPKLMEELDQYISSDISYPVFVNAALIHAQLEMIHPFSSCNGLTGRILLLLHFIWKKKLSVPVLQVSSVLNKRRNEYFDRLGDLERNNNWDGWVKFFLKCITESANKTRSILINLVRLEKEDHDKLIEKEFATTASLKLFEYLLANPVVSVPKITSALGYSKQTTNLLITKFLEETILHETTGKRRYRIYSYKKIINLFDEITA